MSDHQKEQLAWITRIVTLALLGCASIVGMGVYKKTDETYTLVKVYDQRLNTLEHAQSDSREDYRDLLVEIKELRERQFNLQQKYNNQTQ